MKRLSCEFIVKGAVYRIVSYNTVDVQVGWVLVSIDWAVSFGIQFEIKPELNRFPLI